MAHRRGLIVLALSAFLIAACGTSGSNPTQTPGGGGGGSGPSGTQTTGQATTGIGGGGGGGGGGTRPAGWDRYGKVSYSISGPASASGELGFAPASSVFAGSQATLSFYDEATGAILSLRLDGSNAFSQFGDGKIIFTSEQCTTRDLKASAPASGSFECTGPVVVESGAVMTGAKMTGTFTANP